MREADRKKLQNQINANNLLSDTLREVRATARTREGQLSDSLKKLYDNNQKLMNEILTLKATIVEDVLDQVQEGEEPEEGQSV